MKKSSTDIPGDHSADVLAGPIRSDRAGDTTTIWKDGECWREDPHGRAKRLPNVEPALEK